MRGAVTGSSTPRWLDARARERLSERIAAALRRARSGGSPVLASVIVTLPAGVDPTAVAVGSRRPAEHWFCFEQPDRDGAALAGLGCARAIEATGPGRFQAVAARWSAASASAQGDPAEGPPGAGLVAVGGFAFAPDGGGSPQWSGYAPASLIVPEVAFARRGEEIRMTVTVDVAPDDTLEERLEGVQRRLAELREDELPLLDPDPVGSYSVVSPMPPSHYEQAVAQAVQRIRAGELSKVVLAREVQVRAPVDHSPGAVLGVLREAFPSCYVFAVGRGASTFLAASPELLVRREGQRASTVGLPAQRSTPDVWRSRMNRSFP